MNNDQSIAGIRKVLDIFDSSKAEIRPHLILTGPSGSGKTHTVKALCDELGLAMIEVNAAQLTKEGTSGNSLSKALAPLGQRMGMRAVVFVDEFDKLFISGNTNSELAHETTNGVQNEFLTVLENSTAQVFGDYGKYNTIPVDDVLFIFAGAFNGEEGIDLDRLRDFGIKTEFLGRVGLHFGLTKITLEQMRNILEHSPLLETYLDLFQDVDRDTVIEAVMKVVEENHDKNTLGARMLNSLLHQYFVHGTLEKAEVKKTTFQKTLQLAAS